MKTESTDLQEKAQQLWRELDGLDWSSHEQAIVGMMRDALESAYEDGQTNIDLRQKAKDFEAGFRIGLKKGECAICSKCKGCTRTHFHCRKCDCSKREMHP